MIKLFQFPAAFGVPNPSPFCMKAEILLKMAGLPYQSVITPDPRKAPKGKLPMIEDEGLLVADSEFIRVHLERKHGIAFDQGLSAAERAAGHGFARLLEERTYWVMVYNRWIDERHWPVLHRTFFGGMPPVVRDVLPRLIRDKLRRTLVGQGIGRHRPDEIYGFGVADIAALADWLGDKAFFMGAEPAGVDATVYSFVENIITPPFDSPMKVEALRRDNLVAYAKRMRVRYFG